MRDVYLQFGAARVIPQSPASDASTFSDPTLISQFVTVREVVCVQISVCLQSERWRCQYWSADVAAAIISLI
jgi:hypothetical protein